MTTISTGGFGEKIACKYLKKRGMKILEKNFRALRGEIDIIARDDNCVVFIEVKTNSASGLVPPEMRVNRAKQMQIGKIAQIYLQQNDLAEYDCRFDVISIILHDRKQPEVTHIKDAFWLPSNR